VYRSAQAQDERGFVIGEGKPESLDAYDFREGFLQQVVDAWNDPDRAKKESAFQKDFMKAFGSVSAGERIKTGLAASAAAAAVMLGGEVIAATGIYGLLATGAVAAPGISDEIDTLSQLGLNEWAGEKLAGIERPWLEGDSVGAAKQFGGAAGGAYTMARYMFTSPKSNLAVQAAQRAAGFAERMGIGTLGEGSSVLAATDRMFAGLPKGGSTYVERFQQTPVRGGWWSGARGESTFYTYDPKASSMLRGRGVDYANARPDFSPISLEQVKINGMSADRMSNFKLADEALASKLEIPVRDIYKWRFENKYTWHEVEDLTTMQLIPSRINSPIYKHLGGVGEIKRGARK
jgi:hypothetical protein